MLPVRQFYEMLDESQWWSNERLTRSQRSLLGPLLNHARSTVPFYRFRLDTAFRADGSIDWDRWHNIPILSRADLSEHFDALLSHAPVPHHGPFSDVGSSGSTGHAVVVRTTRWLNEMSAACNWRGQDWAGLDWSKPMLAKGRHLPGRNVGDEVGPWGPPWLSTATGPRIYTNYSTPYADDVNIIRGRSVYAYSATTNQLETFFDDLNLTELPALQVIMARGGGVTDYLRGQIENHGSSKLIDVYSSKEGGALAHRCPEAHCWHVNAEAVLVEIVDDAGRPVAPGEKGRVIITPFGSTAMPLIRYDQGDVALAGSPCACGRGLPTMSHIEGRASVMFTHPDGRRRREMMPLEGRQILGAGRWQIRQIGPKAFHVDYVPRDWGTPPDVAMFETMFRTVFFEDSIVTLRAVADFELGETGKYLEYINLWDRADSLRGDRK